MDKIELTLPVRDVRVTQPFGVNYVDFYKGMGMPGHNGLDFRARRRFPIFAAHTGRITMAGKDGDGGIGIVIEKSIKGNGYKTIYYHLDECLVKTGDRVQAGNKIGYSDNTGRYTTGDHLHFGMKFLENGHVKDYDNGFYGAVDPSPYFANKYGKFWYKPAAYHRYGRKQEWLAEFKMRFKNAWLHRQLNKIGLITRVFDTEFINALVYGGWDYEAVINPAMYDNWSNLTKTQVTKKGMVPFSK